MKMVRMMRVVCVGLVLLMVLVLPVATLAADSGQPVDERTQWFKDAKFGMFIHWGVYSMFAGSYQGKVVPSYGEWIMNRARIPIKEYKDMAAEFNPVNYDPEGWAQMAQDAGMKYMVITAKHHDGFAMFDSKHSDWNVVEHTKWGKDLIAPLAKACQKRGIKFGLYYSQSLDWNNAGATGGAKHWDFANLPKRTFDEYLDNVAVPQVKEILSNYGKIDIIWWDMPKDMTVERAEKFLPILELQPGILQNSRLAKGRVVSYDFSTREQFIPPTPDLSSLWESCMTMNHTWGYCKHDHDWKSAEELIHNLIGVVAKGGNYLLNIGPQPDGAFPQASVERLAEMGRWMKVNSEGIYGTQPTPFTFQQAWKGTTTRKDDKDGSTLYLHVYDWPTKGKLHVLGVQNEVEKAYLLVDKSQALKTESSEKGIVIDIPATAPSKYSSTVVLRVKGKLEIKKGSFILAPEGMILLGRDAKTDKLFCGKGASALGNWSKQSTAEWTFDVMEPGSYIIDIAGGAVDDSKMILTCGSQTLPITIPGIGRFSYGSNLYHDFTVGRIDFTKPGSYTLKLSAAEEGWNKIALQSLRLKSFIMTQDEEGTVVLPALAADIKLGESLEVYDGMVYGKRVTEGLEWPFMITRESGTFDIILDYTSSEEAEADIICGKEKVRVVLPTTGGENRRLRYALGKMPNIGSGSHTLKLLPVKDSWNGVKLGSVELWLPYALKNSPDAVSTFPVARASVWETRHRDIHVKAPGKAVDGDENSMWQIPFKHPLPVWFELDLGKEQSVNCLDINQLPNAFVIKDGDLQILKNGQWQTIHKVSSSKAKESIMFPKTTARFFRLVIKDSFRATLKEVRIYEKNSL